MGKKNVRIVEIDILKGIGILLVILGHCVPDYPQNLRADESSSFIEQFVYGFHMPLFFVCSGFLMQMTDSHARGMFNIRAFVKNKTLRLLLPYFMFSIVSLVLRLAFSAFTRSSVDLDNTMYQILFEGKFFWFLYVLFIVSIIINVIKAIKNDMFIAMFLSVALYILGLLLNTQFLCLDRLGYHAIFAVLGCFLYEHKDSVNHLFKKWYIGGFALIVYVCLFFLPSTDCIWLSQIVRFLKALFGTTMTLSLCVNYERMADKLRSIFVYFGKYSLQYYLVHMIISLPVYYLVAMLPIPMPIISVFANFFFITLITYIIVTILLKIEWIYPLIGMKK